jgi:hypothetical protein
LKNKLKKIEPMNKMFQISKLFNKRFLVTKFNEIKITGFIINSIPYYFFKLKKTRISVLLLLTLAISSFNLTAQSWSGTDSMESRRFYHTATLLPSGKVLVTGGSPDHYSGQDDCEIYDPSTGTFSSTEPMSIDRSHHTATLLPSGKVLVTGGYSYQLGTSLGTSEIYDPTTGNWSSPDTLITDRYYHTATLLSSGKVLVSGGFNKENVNFNTCEIYDPSNGKWSATGSMVVNRYYHTATLLSSGNVLVTGGMAMYDGNQSSCEIYDPATGSWSLTGYMETNRQFHSATLLSSGKILVTGGVTYPTQTVLKSSEIYDPSSESWTSTGSMSTARMYPTATLLNTGKVLVTGGWNDIEDGIKKCEIYNPSTELWSNTSSTSTSHINNTATLLSSGKVLVIGGLGFYKPLGIYTGLPYCEIFTPPATNATTPSLSASSDTNCGPLVTSLSIISGSLNDASDWIWYKDSCGGTPVDSGISIQVTPTVTTTYFTRGEGGISSPGNCGNITITVNSLPILDSLHDIHHKFVENCDGYVDFGVSASGFPQPDLKYYLYGDNTDYFIDSNYLFKAYGGTKEYNIKVFATNSCGEDTGQFKVVVSVDPVSITCLGFGPVNTDSGKNYHTINNYGGPSVRYYCYPPYGSGLGENYNISTGASSNGGMTGYGNIYLTGTRLFVGTSRITFYAYDEKQGLGIEQEWTIWLYLGGDALPAEFQTAKWNSLVRSVADSCYFDVTVYDAEPPLLSCLSNQTREANTSFNKYKAIGTEFDPTAYSDNHKVVSVTNNFNNSSSLAGAVFNYGTTRVLWTVTDSSGNWDTCSFTNTVSLCGAGIPDNPNVYSGNVTLNTQTQLDAFYNSSNGEKFTKISGLLTLNGNHYSDPITNLCNLGSLVEITGNLNINNFNKSANPSSLSQLANLITLGCGLNITSNSLLQDATLASLSSIGCSVNIKDNNALKTINMPKLASVQGGQFNIKNNPKLELASASTTAGSFSFTGKGSSMDISDNGSTAAGALAMNFKKVTTLKGALVFHNNDNTGVSNFDNIFTGLTDLSTKWGKLTITNNDYLGTCCIAASVTVGGSGKRHIISGNTGNCLDSATVLANCGVFHKKSPTKTALDGITFNVYPNPNKGNFELHITTSQSGLLNLSVTDLMGREVHSQSHQMNSTSNIPLNLTNLADGLYILKADMNGEVFVKRVMIER